jgi:hypothetical protein
MRYETTTTLAPGAALAAEQFFGDEFGLKVRQRGPQMIGFEGGSGHVVVSVTTSQLSARRPLSLRRASGTGKSRSSWSVCRIGKGVVAAWSCSACVSE